METLTEIKEINVKGLNQHEKTMLTLLKKTAIEVAKPMNEGEMSPLKGCCAAMACMVQAVVGGDIVEGKIGEETHFWNRLPNKVEIDLTSCQFGGDGINPLKKGRKVAKPELLDPEIIMFGATVLNRLKYGKI